MSTAVSVLVACRNGERWLRDAIDSALAQGGPELEVIVVDDHSTDASRAVAGSTGDRRVKVAASAGHGASAARNAAFALAQGDYIQYLDADDLLAPGKVAAQLEALRESPSRCVASGAWARFAADPREAMFVPEPVWRDCDPRRFLAASWLGGGMMPVFAWLTPRALVEEAGPWNESLSVNDDGEFFTRVLLRSGGVVFRGQARGYYRSGSAATQSARADAAGLASDFLAWELSCSHLLAVDGSPEARRACATAYQRFAYHAYPHVPELVARAEARVRSLGGCDLAAPGGRPYQALARLVGWKRARRIQLALRAAAACVRPAPRG